MWNLFLVFSFGAFHVFVAKKTGFKVGVWGLCVNRSINVSRKAFLRLKGASLADSWEGHRSIHSQREELTQGPRGRRGCGLCQEQKEVEQSELRSPGT